MIRFLLRRVIEEYEFKHQRRLSLKEISEATGIVRPTLSLMIGPKPFNTTTNNLGKLCEFFGCQISDLVEYIPEPPHVASASTSTDQAPTRKKVPVKKKTVRGA
jgi:DNA-binding Xre family transcriptional regulator